MSTVYVADRLLPDASTSIAPGAVVVQGERIAWTGPAAEAPAAEETVRLEGCVLCPGLVNAHTHLDLMHLRGRVPFRGDFAAWLEAVGRGRAESVRDPALAAIRGALARGTTAFGDIATPDSFAGIVEAFAAGGARARVFVEAIGFRPEMADAVFERVWELAEMQAMPPNVVTGVSPHSPYTVSRELLERLVAMADGHGRPLAIHLAESLEELAFLHHGIGPLRELLRRFEADDPEHRPYGGVRGVLDLLQLEQAKLLLVHGNYLRPRDVPAGASVVYCPSAHRFFGHPEHAAQEFAEEGVRVALGSDSAASGESVDVLSELQLLGRIRPDLDAALLFRMATEWGAGALDFEAGRLAPGLLADLAAFTPASGHEILGREDARCVLTVVGGRELHRTEPGDAA